MATLADRIQTELDRLILQSKKQDEQYRASKQATEQRIALLRRLQAKISPDLEELLAALGIVG